jgi:hypothetical protein
MKLEIEIPDELGEKLGRAAWRDHLTLEQAVASLAVFQACACGMMFRERDWTQPFAFETFVLPWGVRVTMNREPDPQEGGVGSGR